MKDSLDVLHCDYVEHHGVKGMHWGVRKQRASNRAERIAEKYAVSIAKKTKRKAEKNIRKYEKKQYKLAKPYADKTGHFKITDPKKAEKHFKLSEKIVENKKLVKQIEEALKKGPKEVNKKFQGANIDSIQQMNTHMRMHNEAVRQHQNMMHQVQLNTTMQTIHNFSNQQHFDMMTNMHTVHMHNMHAMGMF